MVSKSESVKELATALAKAQGEIENATKNADNPHFRSRYADLAEIINTSREVLAKHGLSVVQFPGWHEGRATVETVILHASGEWISGVSEAPVSKADPQGVGSATTYLRRYALAAVCKIAQEDDDGSAASSPTTRQNTASNGNGNGSAAPRQKGSQSAPKCDKCGGAMWDNRAKKASGEFKDSSPDFSCKDKQCKHAVWLKDEPTAADEAAEKDRVVAGIESMLREMSGMDAKRTDGARAHVDLIITKPDVTLAELRTLAGMVKKALDEVKKEAATAYTGPNDYDDMPF